MASHSRYWDGEWKVILDRFNLWLKSEQSTLNLNLSLTSPQYVMCAGESELTGCQEGL